MFRFNPHQQNVKKPPSVEPSFHDVNTEKIAAAMLTAEPDPSDAVDAILSRELEQLSFQDFQAIHEEVHGVRTLAPEENPALWRASLECLAKELAILRPRHTVYDQACRISNSYVNESGFRLRFLRAESFDAKKAAARLVAFLELAYEFYGPLVLQRPIQFSDLTKQEADMLRDGELQPLPFRDRSGRRVLVALGTFYMQYPLEMRIKVNLYLHWAISEDVETQQKGLVGVFCWPCGESASTVLQNMMIPKPGSRDCKYAGKLFAAMPLRLVAVHLCFPNSLAYNCLRSGLALTMGDKRSRLRFHCGDCVETQYNLQGYGIPTDQLPITDSGNIKTKYFHQWIRVRKSLESGGSSVGKPGSSANASTIECPGMNDVIFRCGQAYLCHPGNIMFRGLIESKYEDHNQADISKSKVAITWWIMEQVEQRNGRFLIWDNGCWELMTDRQQIRLKVASAFKDHKRRLRAHLNCQVNESSTHKFERQDGKKRKRQDDSSESGSNCFKLLNN